MRLPGFYNHKYGKPQFVSAEPLSHKVYAPEDFPDPHRRNEDTADRSKPVRQRPRVGNLSQSERDWAYAKRALARGESPALIASAIENYRRYEKHNPRYYAELTVKNAANALEAERTAGSCPERT